MKAVELAKRNIIDSIWKTAGIEVRGITFPQTYELMANRVPAGLSVYDIVVVNNIKRAWQFALDNVDYAPDWQHVREYNRLLGEGGVIPTAG